MTEPARQPGRREVLRGGVSIPALAAFLSACGGDNTGALGGGGGNGGDVSEIVVPTSKSPWLDSYREVLSHYEEETGVRVQLREFPFEGLLTQQINAVQNQSGAFDVLQVNEGWTGQFYGNGWVVPLSEVDASFSWPEALLEYDGVGRWNDGTKLVAADGKPMGVPMNGNVHLLFYRKDRYDDLGLSVPTTFDEAIRNGRRAQDQGAAKHGYVARGEGTVGGYAVTFDFGPVLHGFGGDWFVDPGSDWTPRINDDAGIAAMEKFKELLALGPAQPQTVGQAVALSLLQSGEAMQSHMVAAAAPQLDDPNKSAVAGKMAYDVVPAGTQGRSPMSGTWVLGIPPGLPPERQQAASDFINWLVSKQTMMAWAKEGGIVTRSDVLSSDLANESQYRHFTAMVDSAPHVHGGIRYPFSQPMLEATEVNLAQIVAGETSTRQGLDKIAAELEKIVEEAGLGS